MIAGMINLSKINRTPDVSKYLTHHFCDYIELLALIDSGDGVSPSDVYDRFAEDGDVPEIGSQVAAEVFDKWTTFIEQLFGELEVRRSTYENYYPFELVGGRIKKLEIITDLHYCYLSLLICSSIKYVDNRSTFTSAFEFISYLAIKNFLPAFAQVHIFGVSSGKNTIFNGSLEAKINLLANHLGESVSNKPNVFRSHNNGDGGADIVAWIPYDNDSNLDKKLIFLGQSASGVSDWEEKQASVEKIRNYINFVNPPINVLFVPFDFRDSARHFTSASNITATMLFDRFRIVRLLKPEELFPDGHDDALRTAITRIIETEEDIV